ELRSRPGRNSFLDQGDAARELLQPAQAPLRLGQAVQPLLRRAFEGAVERSDVCDGLVQRHHRSSFFTITGRPATISTTSCAAAASRWLAQPARSRNRRASGLSGTMPAPTSLVTSTTEKSRRGSACASPSIWFSTLGSPRKSRLLSH